jgi:hypothetical protein
MCVERIPRTDRPACARAIAAAAAVRTSDRAINLFVLAHPSSSSAGLAPTRLPECVRHPRHPHVRTHARARGRHNARAAAAAPPATGSSRAAAGSTSTTRSVHADVIPLSHVSVAESFEHLKPPGRRRHRSSASPPERTFRASAKDYSHRNTHKHKHKHKHT